MLASLRKSTGSILIKGLLFLLIISFGAWGIQDWLSPAISGSVVAKAGDIEITQYDLRQAVNRQMRQLQSVFGRQVTMEQARQLGLVSSTLNDMISRALINKGASDMGILISDSLVRQKIKSQKSLMGADGEFDRLRFERLLQSTGISETSYVSELRSNMAIGTYIDSLSDGGYLPNLLVELIYNYKNEKRVVDILEVKTDSMKIKVDASQLKLEEFYKNNNKTFELPEYRALTFLQLESKDIATSIFVDDREIKEKYENSIENFSIPEKRKVSQLIFETKEKAKKAFDNLSLGLAFSKVGEEYGFNYDPAGLDLGFVSKSELLTKLKDPVFKLKLGQISKPIKTEIGWHIFKVFKIEAGSTKSFVDAKVEIKQELALIKAGDQVFELTKRIEDQLGGGATLEETAKLLDIKIKKIKAINKKGYDRAGILIDSVGKIPTLLKTSFSLNEGEESLLLENGQDGFFVVRVDSVFLPEMKPLESIRSDVMSVWRNKEREKKAEKTAKEIIVKLNSSHNISSILDPLGISSKTSKPFLRSDVGQISNISVELIKKVFSLDVGETAYSKSKNGFQVIKLKRIVAARLPASSEATELLHGELSSELKSDLIGQLGEALKREFGVDVNKDAINQIFLTNQSP